MLLRAPGVDGKCLFDLATQSSGVAVRNYDRAAGGVHREAWTQQVQIAD